MDTPLKHSMHKYFAILFSLSIVTPVFAQHVQVLDLPDQNKIILKNSDIEVHFSKNNASISKLLNQNGINLLGPKGAAYLLGPGFSMANSTCKIVRQEKDLVELSFYHEADNHFQ
jgi:hypothetical protein